MNWVIGFFMGFATMALYAWYREWRSMKRIEREVRDGNNEEGC